ncbi:VOC family protein [Kineosporia succinea]|uniref:Catechol 2,3-dioxygenase-like lactoylglutathione lyase family enzyme n=1 Tax=Kineosporia succinea TaxID=84632 RepID=A0ABT9P4Q9_9ACTN|nr:VOC family protein [Kineosporia succinea]MDP9827680.1 catechol 2,3-dioxygenase-like lactoylglutathione lyase family enzyme [Kineosporia succinea]
MKLRLAVIEFVVSDMAATLAFYRLLGLDLPDPAVAGGEPHVQADLGGIQLAFDTEETIRSFHPEWTRPPAGAGQSAVALLAGSPGEVDEAYAAVVAAGYEGELAPWDAVWGQRYAVVRDPDGNQVDLFAPLG